MNFQKFQGACKYAQWGAKDDVIDFELTCRNPKNVPQGSSWGVCNVKCCPYYGTKILGGAMYDAETGKKLMEFGPGEIVF